MQKYRQRTVILKEIHQESGGRERDALYEILKRMFKELDEKRASLVCSGCKLPQDFTGSADGYQKADVFTKISETPWATLASLRNIADTLGFVMLPVTYLTDEILKYGDSYSCSNGVGEFAKLCQWFDIYALCPPTCYDVSKHTHSEQDLPIYAGPLNSQAFMALNMTIPMFRSVVRQLGSLRRKVDEISDTIEAVEREIKSMKVRLDQIQQQSEQLIRQSLRQKELEIWQSKTPILAQDPLLFGIPKGQPITGDGSAILGPCWGADFEDDVLTGLGFKKVKAQRESLALLAKRW
jgi:hypothetical protein